MANNETRCDCCGFTDSEREQLFVIGGRLAELNFDVDAFLRESQTRI